MTSDSRSSTAALSSADATFIRHCLAIDKLLVSLAEHQAKHFGVDPEKHRDWTDVEKVEELRKRLEKAVLFLESGKH